MFQQNVTLSPGTGTFTSHTFEILIMLLGAFLLGLWLGYAVWARYKEMADKLRLENMSNLTTIETMRTDITTARNRITVLETDGTNLNAQIASLNRNNTNMRDRISELESELTAASAHIRQLETELGLSYEPDVPVGEGIPLEITATYDDNYAVAELAEPEPIEESPVEEAPVEEAPAILNIEPLPIETKPQEVIVTIPEMTFTVPIGGTNSIRPETMGTMATTEPETTNLIQPMTVGTMAKAESENTNFMHPITVGTTTKAEPDNQETLTPAVVGALGESDDLTVIEGIGPKIQMLLNQYGIYTYRQLADTDVARMKEILAAAGSQLAMHDPGTWPSQANLAANDQWEALKSIQGFLKGGKKPV